MSTCELDRRAFVRRVGVGLLAGAVPFTVTGCGGLTYLTPVEAAGALRVRVADVPASGALLQTPTMERPVYLHVGAEGAPIAVLARCTHRGCQPAPVGDRLVCPCHGSEFSRTGEVLQGPAEAPLIRYQVRRDGDDWVVRTASGGAG